jgi:hypothetical protein
MLRYGTRNQVPGGLAGTSPHRPITIRQSKTIKAQKQE